MSVLGRPRSLPLPVLTVSKPAAKFLRSLCDYAFDWSPCLDTVSTGSDSDRVQAGPQGFEISVPHAFDRSLCVDTVSTGSDSDPCPSRTARVFEISVPHAFDWSPCLDTVSTGSDSDQVEAGPQGF